MSSLDFTAKAHALLTGRVPARVAATLPPILGGAKPLLGHIPRFQKEPMELLHEGHRKHGEMFTIQLFDSPAVTFVGPQAHEAYFNASQDHLDPKEIYKIMTPIFGKGIAYDAEPAVMREQVGFLHPALKPARMKTYAEKFAEEAELYFEKWGDEGVVDILDTTVELTTYTSSRCLLGPEFRANMTVEFGQLYQDMEAGLNPIGFFFPYLPLPAFRKRDRARARMVEILTSIIAQRRASGARHEDMLQTLMEATYQDGRSLTNDEITGLLLTIIFAGHHTSSVLNAWLAINLLQNPEHFGRLHAEQQRVYGTGRPISFDALKELSYLEWCAQETLRLYPPLVILMRKVQRDFHYKNWVIPEGSVAMVSPQVSHRLREVFPNPHRFDPERFSPERAEDRGHRYNLITFGGGMHRCIGEKFALMQTKAIWSVLLNRFELELASPTYYPNYEQLVVGPGHPALIRYRRRKKLLVSVPSSVGAGKTPTRARLN